MKNLFLSAVLLTATTIAAAKKPNDGFVSLFNGKDLEGVVTLTKLNSCQLWDRSGHLRAL